MKKYFILPLIIVFAINGFAQNNKKSKQSEQVKNTNPIAKTATPLEFARAALAAHGGDKFKNMKTLVVIGTADVSGSPTMTFPAPFNLTFSGDKYRLENKTPFIVFKQIYDGEQTFSSNEGVTLPPLNRLGLPLLPKIEEKDFVVSELPEKNKKAGFRVTAPDGFYTDFFVDVKTGLVKSYESSYVINGRNISTSVEIDKVRDVDGVKVPERYAQRFELGQLTVYSDFKAKEILVNSKVADDVFVMSK
jgi:hypothetical protein